MFEKAGSAQRALQEYTEAVRIDPGNTTALLGAADTLFHLQQYPQAQQYLTKLLEVDPSSQKAQQLLALAQRVQDHDPLAPHLGSGERQRRLFAGLDQSMQRLNACLGRTSDGTAVAELTSLQGEAQSSEQQWKNAAHPLDSDAVTAGVALIFKMQQAAASRCGEPQEEDQALLLIGREHASERR